MFRSLADSRELAWRLLVRNISAQYRQTVLGYVWAFLPPVVTTLTFALLNSGGVFQIGGTELPLVAYMLISTSLWQVFADGVQGPLRVVAQSTALLQKVNFPHEALVLTAVGEAAFNFLVRSVLIVATFLWFNLDVHASILLFPLGLASLLALGTMIGVLLVPIGVLYRDVQNVVTMALPFAMLLTPVVYPPPEEGPAAAFIRWNPVTPLLEATRDWLTIGATDSLPAYLAVTGVVAILTAFGWLLYRLSLPHVVSRLGG